MQNFIKSAIVFTFLLVFLKNETLAQCGVGAIDINLSADPEATIITPDYVRNEPGSCITFRITLHPAASGIKFSIASGASPAGALTYSKDCGPSQPYTEFSPICFSGAGPHIVTFCKPGANPNTYRISSVAGVVAGSNSLAGSNSEDLICEGGTLNLTASTIPNATYSWTGPNGFSSNLQNPSLNGVTLAASGTYSVAVTQIGGCTSPLGSTIVAINATPLPPGASSNGPICAGETLNLSAGAIAGATYTWNGPNGFTSNLQNPSISNTTIAASGTYQVTARVGNCTSEASILTVVVNPIPVITATPAIQTICSGTSSSIALSSNIASTTYSWAVTTSSNITGASNGSGSNIVQALTNTGTTAGTATYTITPLANGCAGEPISVILTVNPNPVVVATTPNEQTICSGGATSLLLNSNISGTNFSWTVAQSGVSGASSGSGTSINQTLFTTGLVSGTAEYTVTPTLNGCSGNTYQILVTVNPRPEVSVPANFSICAGTNVPITSFTSTPSGATFSWTNSNPDIGLSSNGVGGLPSFNATNTMLASISATITVTPTLNGCTGNPSSFVIRVFPVTTVNVPPSSTVCAGSVIPTTSFASSPNGATFTWTNSNTNIGLAANGTGNVPSFTSTNLQGSPITSVITVTPVLNGCPGTPSSYNLTVNPLPEFIEAIKTDITACGVNDGTITISATGEAPLSYSIDGGATFQNSNIYSGLAAGSYSVVVRNGLGCIIIGPVLSISVPIPPAAPSIVNNSPVCEGADLTMSISAPDPSKIYTWTGPEGYNETGSSVTRMGVTSSMAGNYSVTATDIATNCVSAPTIFLIVVKPLPTVSVPSDITICNNGSVAATAFSSTPNGADYTWSADNTNIGLPAATGTGDIPSFTATNSGNSPISSTITVIPSLDGCEGTAETYVITVNPTPTVIATPPSQTVCSGTAPFIELSSNMPSTTFTWTVVQTGVSGALAGSGNVIDQVITAVSGTAVYTITPSLNGCEGAPIDVTITVNPVPVAETIVSENQEICSETTTNIPLSSNVNGTTFSWTVSQTGVTGASSNDTGSAIIQTLTATGSTPGTAIYTIIPTATSCDGEPLTVTVIVNPLPVVNVPASLEVCSGTNIPATAFTSLPAGATYNWTNSNPAIGLVSSGGGNIPSFIAENLTSNTISGTITVTATINGCLGPASTYTINVKPLPTVILPPNSIIFSCAGSTVPEYVLTSDPPDATYTWTNSNPAIGLPSSGTGNIPSFTSVNSSSSNISGLIIITPTLNGCTGTPRSFTITIKPLPVLNVSPSAAIICSGSSVSLSANGAQSYFWTPSTGLSSTSGATVIASPLTTTTYTVFATDANGCSNAKNVTVFVNPPVTVNVTPQAVKCTNGNDGGLQIDIGGGTAPYRISYRTSGGTYSIPVSSSNGSFLIGSLTAGIYDLRVVDVYDCPREVLSVSVTEPPQLTASFAVENAICKFSSDGKITLTVNGGIAPYTYNWANFTNNSPTLTNIPAGTYQVTVTDLNNCSLILNIDVLLGNCAPTAINDLFTGTEDNSVNGNVALNDNDVDGDNLIFNNLSNPANGSFTFNADGTFLFTPTPNWNGTTTFDYQVCDLGGLCDIATATILISPTNDPPVANNDNFNTLEDTPVNGTVSSNDSDLDGDVLTYSPLTNPANGTLRFNNDGTFIFTPTPNWNGTTSFEYRACDPSGLCDNAVVTIVVTPVNDPPVANPDVFRGAEDFPINETVRPNDIDPDGDNLTYTQLTNPANGTLVFNTDGTFTFIPNQNWNGTSTFEYQVCDPFNLCDTTTVSIIIYPVNDPPIANPDFFTTFEDTPLNGSVVLNDSDPDGDVLTFTRLTTPANGTLIFNANGTFTFTPNLNWNGNTTFNYLVCDPFGLCDTTSVSITITPVNDPPIANPDRFRVLKDSTIQETVINNDSDPENDFLTYRIITNPVNGNVIFNPNGSFIYTPDTGYTGIDTFIYETCDPFGACDTAIVTLLVQPRVIVNLIPPTGTIKEGEQITITAQLTEPLLEDVFITLRYSGTAENRIDYNLEDSFITLRFMAGDILAIDFLTVKAKIDALKEGTENILIAIDSTSSTFVIIGTGSDIAITDIYPESKPIGPEENPDINPDPLISPNDDGVGNDSFIIYNIARYPDNEVIIFNRWGNEVFRLSNYNNEDRAFKGIANTGILTNSNTPLVDGVYYFIIYTKDATGERKLNKGYIILKR